MSSRRPTGASQFLRLPSATTARFLILVVATAGVALYFLPQPLQMAFLVAADLDVLPRVWHTRCPEDALALVGNVPARELRREYLDCAALASTVETGTWVAALALPLSIGLLIYTLYPRWLRRRLRPLARPELAQAAYAERELARALGSRRGGVRLLVTPGTAGGARAFGAWGRYWIAVDRSLLPATGSAPGSSPPRSPDRGRTGGPPGRQPDASSGRHANRSDALIHHEAAHVLNRDIDITYLAIAVWWGLVLCAVPATALMFPTPSGGWGRTALLAVLLVVLSHTRSRVLQVREFYADVRAAHSPGVAVQLLHLLPTARPERLLLRWWRALSSSHPPPGQRAETIRDPSRLQNMHVLDLFYAGCTVGLGYVGFQYLANSISEVVGAPYTWIVGNASGILFGVLAAFVVCAFVWRASLGSLVRAEPRTRVFGAASALTAGVLLGQVVGPGNLEASWVYLLELRPGAALVLAVLLWIVFSVILRWILMVATTWLSVSESVWPLWPCVAVSALMFVLALTHWFYIVGHMTVGGSARPVPPSILNLLVLPITDPAWIATACLGAALPLLAWSAWGRELSGRDAAPRLCPPWIPVAFSAVVLLGLIVVVAGALRWLIERVVEDMATSDSVLSLAAQLGPLLLVCLGVVLAITVVSSWMLGGRGARARVLSTTVLALFLTSFLAIPAVHTGIAVGACVRGFDVPGACGDSFDGFGAKAFTDFVNTGSFVFVPLLLVCVPAALAASSLRTVAGIRPWPVRPAPGRWYDLLALAASALLGAVALLEPAATPAPEPEAERGTPYTATVPGAPAGEGPLTGRQTCEAVDTEYYLAIDFLNNPWSSAAGTTHVLARSTDPVLAAFAEPALEVFDGGDEAGGVTSSMYSQAAAQHYCALRHPGTGLLRNPAM
ncbi:hypothetical protein [Nocardiopsis sp. CA-288880]|uniref:hypothetical protein n=1 Tax=Nocardiopsis sp. CA-288880 TaxID=3239995 RepID=UPI003D99C644